MKFLPFSTLIVLCLLSGFRTNASSCSQKWAKWSVSVVKEEIEYNDLIFLGEVINSDGYDFKIKVINVFKGAVLSDTITGSYRDKCYLTPREGMWIVYSKIETTNTGIRFKEISSLSRSITHPLSNNMPLLLPPPSQKIRSDSAALADYHDAQLEFTLKQEKEMLPIFLKNWMSEYALLTAYNESINEQTIFQVLGKNLISYLALAVAALSLIIVLIKKQ